MAATSTPALTDPLFAGLFWDTPAADLDWEKHAVFICERILERGTWEQWRAIRDYYGPVRLPAMLRSSRRISRKAVSFLAVCFDVPVTDFLAWTQEQVGWEA